MEATLNALLQTTKEQAKAEAERVVIENNRLGEEKRRNEYEAERLLQLHNIADKLDILLNIIQTVLLPNANKTAYQNELIIEILRIIASIYTNISQEDAHQMEVILDKMINRINTNVNIGTNFSATNDMNISSKGDQKING